MDSCLKLADYLSQRPWCKATLADATAGRKYTYDNLHSLVLDCHRRRGRNARNTLRKFLSIAPKREHVEKPRKEAAFEKKKKEEEDSQEGWLVLMRRNFKLAMEFFDELKKEVEEKYERSHMSYLKRSLESYLNRLEKKCSAHDPGWFWLWSCLFWVLFSSLCFSLLTSHALAQLLVAVITHRLLSSGDIERNPGPIYRDEKPTPKKLQYMSYTSEDGSTVHFRLMDRITPRVARLAIALSFPRHIRESLNTNPDPVVYLFDIWLRGANQEHDPSPLTWGTLINGLNEANLPEEVKILEENFVIERPVVDTRASVTISNDEEQMTDKEISKETDELPKYKTAQNVNSSSSGIHNALCLFLIILTIAVVPFAMLVHVYVAVSSAVVPSCPPSYATPPTPPC